MKILMKICKNINMYSGLPILCLNCINENINKDCDKQPHYN